MTVALGDGVGQLRAFKDGGTICATLSAVASEVGEMKLVLGWVPAPPDGLDPACFTETISLMPG